MVTSKEDKRQQFSFLIGNFLHVVFYVAIVPPPRHMTDVLSCGLAKLRWEKYSPAYRARLAEAGLALQKHLSACGLHPSLLMSQSAEAVDEILETFIARLNSNSCSRSLRIAKHALLFVQLCRPRLKKQLQNSWSLIHAWEEQHPGSYRPPLPIPLLVCMICKARALGLRCGSESERELWWTFATMLAVGFFGLLRPGELFRVVVADIGLPNSLSLAGDFAVIRISQAKNARQMGRQQFATIRNWDTINWLSWIVNCLRNPKQKLWCSSPQKFRKMFREVCIRLQIGNHRFSPASLRAGGATWRVDLQGEDIAKLRFDGRWTNLRSLEHYLQVARAQQLMLDIPQSTSQGLVRFMKDHLFMLCLPQVLRLKVPQNHLLSSLQLCHCGSHNVGRVCNCWGNNRRPEEAVSQDSDCGRLVERSQIFRRERSRPSKSSQVLQK